MPSSLTTISTYQPAPKPCILLSISTSILQLLFCIVITIGSAAALDRVLCLASIEIFSIFACDNIVSDFLLYFLLPYAGFSLLKDF